MMLCLLAQAHTHKKEKKERKAYSLPRKFLEKNKHREEGKRNAEEETCF